MIKIDKNKLIRDYKENPLVISRKKGKTEYPYKKDVEYLYLELNMSLKELMNYFNCSSSFLTTIFKKLGIKKPKELKNDIRRQTNLERYGCESPLQKPEIKEKMRQTNLERYGCENPFQNQEIKEKIKISLKETYGVEHPMYSNDLKEKIRQTNLERYGCESPFQNQEIKEKIKQTNLERYGCENVSQNKGIREKVVQTNLERYGKISYTQTDEYKEKTISTNLERYGCEYDSQNPNIRLKIKQTNLERYGCENPSQRHISKEILDLIHSKEKLEKYIIENNVHNATHLSELIGISSCGAAKYIRDYNLSNYMDYSKSIQETEIRQYINQYFETENNTRKYLDGKEIDIFIPEKNIGIEFNGNFWHNEFGKEKQYHQEKSLLAESKGIFLYHIFEYEWDTKREQIINQLNNLLGLNRDKIYARKCIIKEVDNETKKIFLDLNHLQGDDKSSIKMGLYYNNELVSLMTFVKPRFNKNYQWELSRFCSKAGCNVIGGASKLFKYFVKTYNPKSIISYSNIAHTRGVLYQTLGMTLQGISEPNYIWFNYNSILNRYQCQKHKLLEQGFKGDSEAEIMHDRGYYRIYDCGNKVWVWKRGSN